MNRWATAVAGSVVAHAALLLLVWLAVMPDDEPEAPAPETRIRMETHPVEQQRAQAAEPGGTAANESDAGGDIVSQAGIPTSRAGPATPAADRLAAMDAATEGMEPSAVQTVRVVGASATGEQPTEREPPGQVVPAASLPASPVGPRPSEGLELGQEELQSARVAELAPDLDGVVPIPAARLASALGPGRPALDRLGEVSRVGALASPADAGAAPAARIAVDAERPSPAPGEAVLLASAAVPTPDAPPTVTPPAELVLATLAWSGGAEVEVDPVSLAAIQSFMQPGDLPGQGGPEIRDAMSALLVSVPCARLQTIFRPESGRLELHGHIPDEGLRAPVLAALGSQIGTSIPLTDSMLILPRPQCATLAAIAATTLPQSSDESTNPRVVGKDAYARIYDFAEDERLIFELTGPDYPAHVYADYYDSEGMVIHLEPNEVVPLRRVEAAGVLDIGGVDERLELRAAPPFGQEIVVAMATSSPLYAGVRPLREPALPYLDFVRERVRQARMRDATFKGEWVYFFVRTHPGM